MCIAMAGAVRFKMIYSEFPPALLPGLRNNFIFKVLSDPIPSLRSRILWGMLSQIRQPSLIAAPPYYGYVI
jgi:hypothetical protein